MTEDACICRGNWRSIVGKARADIGKRFHGDGQEWTFFGIVYGSDDYYYGMWNGMQLSLLSCVGTLEAHGYVAIQKDVSG